MKLLVLILLFFNVTYAHADFFRKDDFEVALGAQYSSLLQKRGIITYEGFQAVPIYSIQLGNPSLLLAGSALYYTQNIFTENQIFRIRLNVDSTLDHPLYYTDEDEEDRIRRESTSELDLFYELRSKQGSHLRWMFSQDLKAHKGFYTEIYSHIALIDFFKNDKGQILVQPGVFISLGGGNQEHNRYLYGEGASHFRATNVQYGLSILSLGAIDEFWPTLRVSRFEILGDSNRTASYVEETQGWQAELLFAFKVY